MLADFLYPQNRNRRIAEKLNKREIVRTCRRVTVIIENYKKRVQRHSIRLSGVGNGFICDMKGQVVFTGEDFVFSRLLFFVSELLFATDAYNVVMTQGRVHQKIQFEGGDVPFTYLELCHSFRSILLMLDRNQRVRRIFLFRILLIPQHHQSI